MFIRVYMMSTVPRFELGYCVGELISHFVSKLMIYYRTTFDELNTSDSVDP
jgi:hypothetical protein